MRSCFETPFVVCELRFPALRKIGLSVVIVEVSRSFCMRPEAV
jgi:hypothetical protein